MRSEAELINLLAENGFLIESIPKDVRTKAVKMAAISKNYTSARPRRTARRSGISCPD